MFNKIGIKISKTNIINYNNYEKDFISIVLCCIRSIC